MEHRFGLRMEFHGKFESREPAVRSIAWLGPIVSIKQKSDSQTDASCLTAQLKTLSFNKRVQRPRSFREHIKHNGNQSDDRVDGVKAAIGGHDGDDAEHHHGRRQHVA